MPLHLPALLHNEIPNSGGPRAPGCLPLTLPIFGLQMGKYNSGSSIEESLERPQEPCASWEGGSR